MEGYKVFLKAGSAPDVDVDTEAATLADSAVSWTEAISTLALDADEVYHVALHAFNDTGNSPAIRSTFRTDENGDPVIHPAPVSNLRVRTLAAGEAEITFDYVEPLGVALADSFEFEIESLDGGDPIEVDDLPIGGPSYRVRVSGDEGRYRVKVLSKLAGAFEPAVSGVEFVLDATAPDGGVYGFEVV